MGLFYSYDTAIGIIAIMIAIAGIVLGIGYAADHRRLKEWGKTELIQAAINGVIVGSLLLSFSPFGIMTGIINGITNGSGASATCSAYMQDNSALCFAYSYLTGPTVITFNGHVYPTLTAMSFTMLAGLSAIDIGAGIIGSINIDIFGFSIGLSQAMMPFLSQMRYITDGVALAFFSVQLQGMVMSFIAAVAIPVLLPVGIVLRTFYFTRALGGTIIALVIGLYVVFPMTYLMDAQLSNQYYQTAITGVNSYQTVLNGAENWELSLYSNSNSINPTNAIISGIQDFTNSITSGIVGLVQELIDFLAYMVIEVFLIPLLSVMLTVVSTRELARLLGSEISFGRFDVF